MSKQLITLRKHNHLTKTNKNQFIPGKTYIPVSGKVFDDNELSYGIQAILDGWWTEGRFATQFENEFSKFLGIKYCSLVNSGSSANLLAVAALTSKKLGTKRLKPGDEFITTPVAFPTTVNPGIIYGLKPVFIDVGSDSLNINPSKIAKVITKRTKLIMIAHTLGKPFNLDRIMKLVRKYDLWLVEDCCDALGSKYNQKHVGTFGHMATFSFYPAHQITMGEGGAVVTNDPFLHRSIRQYRDWGRDCWCSTGKDNSCGKRFSQKHGKLPFGYDHKYVYSQIGYNLKLTDMQAAIGCAQLKKLTGFIEKRKANYHKLYIFFSKYPQLFQLQKTSPIEDPCWFGFPVIINKNAPFTRNQFTEYLENHHIGTRNVFAGNLCRHPAYLNLKHISTDNMTNADKVMDRAFWIGVWPAINKSRLAYMIKTINSFIEKLIIKEE